MIVSSRHFYEFKTQLESFELGVFHIMAVTSHLDLATIALTHACAAVTDLPLDCLYSLGHVFGGANVMWCARQQ